MLKETLKGENEVYLGAIWLLFIHLVEKCSETGYKTALRALTLSHHQEIEAVKNERK